MLALTFSYSRWESLYFILFFLIHSLWASVQRHLPSGASLVLSITLPLISRESGTHTHSKLRPDFPRKQSTSKIHQARPHFPVPSDQGKTLTISSRNECCGQALSRFGKRGSLGRRTHTKPAPRSLQSAECTPVSGIISSKFPGAGASQTLGEPPSFRVIVAQALKGPAAGTASWGQP